MKKPLFLLFIVFLFAFQVYAFSDTQEGSRPSLKNNDTKKAEAAAKAKETPPAELKKAGKITKIKGTVTIMRGKEKLSGALKMIVNVGDKIEVAAKSLVDITLFNVPGIETEGDRSPTVLRLSENSKLTLKERKTEPNGDITTKINLDEGKLDSSVTDGRKEKWKARRDRQRGSRAQRRRQSSTKSNYEVTTPTAIAGVRGTEFIVAVTPSKTFVYVRKGSVWVKDRVKGEIRTIKRKRLLEIGITGFGFEFKPEEQVIEEMANKSFESSSFNPVSFARKIQEISHGDSPKHDVAGDRVDSDVKDKMDATRGTSNNDGSPDPTDTSNFGGSSSGTGPTPPPQKNLPAPPPPPPAPNP